MKSAGIVLISAAGLVAGILLYEALKPSPLHAPDPAIVQARVDRLEAEARRAHPGMAPSEAMKEVALRQAREAMAQGDAKTRAQKAAGIFFGAYVMNTRARPTWCRQRGVDLTPFANAYTSLHRDELARTQAIFAEAGLNPDTFIAPLEAQFVPMVEQNMRDVANGAGVPLDKACTLFNEKAQQIAQAMTVPQEVKQALLAPR